MRLGIDVGSTTVKLVFLDEDNNIIYSRYERHMSNAFLKVQELIKEAHEEFGDQRMENAKPLVRVMLTQAQEALATGSVATDLKFGHDHPIVATAGWFGLEGVGDRLRLEDLPDAWADPMNIPFATNFQLVFYRNRNGEVLVKFVYNGRERLLHDLTPVSGPYYRWSDVLSRFLPE